LSSCRLFSRRPSPPTIARLLRKAYPSPPTTILYTTHQTILLLDRLKAKSVCACSMWVPCVALPSGGGSSAMSSPLSGSAAGGVLSSRVPVSRASVPRLASRSCSRSRSKSSCLLAGYFCGGRRARPLHDYCAIYPLPPPDDHFVHHTPYNIGTGSC